MISLVEILQRMQAEIHPDSMQPKPQLHYKDIQEKNY